MSKWKTYKFEEIIFDDTRNGTKIKKEDYLEQGLYPIIDQGQNQIAGYRNTDDGLYDDTPAIIFGDHTRVIKYISNPFFLGADGVKLLKTKRDNVDYKYLFYFFLKNEVPNTGYNRHFKWLKELVIPLPTLETQKQIAKTLDTAAELLVLRKQQLAELDKLIKSTFYDMFGDPVANEKGWKMHLIENTIASEKNAIKGGPFGSALKKEFYVEQGYKIYGQEQVINNDATYGDYYISENKYKELENCAVQEDDVLISLVGTYGKLLIIPKEFEEGIINPRLMKITFDKTKVNTIYFKYYFLSESLKKVLSGASRGGTMDILNVGIVRKLSMPLTPIELQNQFAEIVTKIEEQKALVQKAIDETQCLFDSLMSEYFE